MRFVAVGQSPVGVIAIGQVPTGVIAIGQLATGVVAIGQLSRGVIAIGQLAVGVFAFGQLAVGGWAGGMVSGGVVEGPALLGYGAFGHLGWHDLRRLRWQRLERYRRGRWGLAIAVVVSTLAVGIVWVVALSPLWDDVRPPDEVVDEPRLR